MKIGILTTGVGWHSSVLKEEAVKKGHQCEIVTLNKIKFVIKGASFDVQFGNMSLLDLDVLLVRGMKSGTTLRVVLEMLRNNGVKIIDRKLVSHYDNNSKIYTHMKLSQAGLPTPEICWFDEAMGYDFVRICKSLGPKTNSKIIMKLASSSKGQGVFLIDSQERLDKIISDIPDDKYRTIFFQKYFEHKGDYRVFVVGTKVIGIMYRKKIGDDFRSNIAHGSLGQKAELPEEIKELAIKATKVLDMQIAGVDILISNDKPYILEVNRSPQFGGFTKATGINVAAEIIKFLTDY